MDSREEEAIPVNTPIKSQTKKSKIKDEIARKYFTDEELTEKSKRLMVFRIY